MIYELRIYRPAEGRAEALKRRFVDRTLPFFSRHGIEVLGVFEPKEGSDRIVYVTRFADDERRTEAWAAFQADPEWKAIKAESETAGPLIQEQTVLVLDPVVAGLMLG